MSAIHRVGIPKREDIEPVSEPDSDECDDEQKSEWEVSKLFGEE